MRSSRACPTPSSSRMPASGSTDGRGRPSRRPGDASRSSTSAIATSCGPPCAAKVPHGGGRRPRERRLPALRAHRLPAPQADRGPRRAARRSWRGGSSPPSTTGESRRAPRSTRRTTSRPPRTGMTRWRRPRLSSSCSRRSRSGSARSCGDGCRGTHERRGRGAHGDDPGNVDVIFFRAMRQATRGARAMSAERGFADFAAAWERGERPDPATAIAAAAAGRARAARGDDRRLPGRAPPHGRLRRRGGRARRRPASEPRGRVAGAAAGPPSAPARPGECSSPSWPQRSDTPRRTSRSRSTSTASRPDSCPPGACARRWSPRSRASCTSPRRCSSWAGGCRRSGRALRAWPRRCSTARRRSALGEPAPAARAGAGRARGGDRRPLHRRRWMRSRRPGRRSRGSRPPTARPSRPSTSRSWPRACAACACATPTTCARSRASRRRDAALGPAAAGAMGDLGAPRRAGARRRFTVAHEVGHHLLHSDGAAVLCRPADVETAAGDERTREREANRFAAELLMPEPLVRAGGRPGRTRPDRARGALRRLRRRDGLSAWSRSAT